jgi:F0F1-type ATP synthase beta subunit
MYPAIDPVQARSRLVAPHIVDAAPEMLRESPSDARTSRIRDFLKQWFFVAEEFTHHPGESVPLDDAVQELALLVHD